MKKLIFLILAVAFSHTRVFSQGCLPEGITFTTQAQIDNFPVNYPGCTTIEGDLTIEGSDITNLNGLIGMTSVGGDLYIRNTYLLDNLSGLNNLTYVEGNLQIGDIYNNNWALTSLTALNALTSIGGALRIENNLVLADLSGLEGLTSIPGDLSIKGNAALTTLTALEGLTSIPGSLEIMGNNTLTSLSGLDNLSSIGGDLSLTWTQLTSLTGLINLVSLGGNIIIGANANLTSLTGLEGLTTVPGNIQLCALIDMGCAGNGFVNLSGFDNLTSIGGSLDIYHNFSLINLTGLDNLDSIGGQLNINGTTFLTDLTGLNNLTTVGGLTLGQTSSHNMGGNSILSLNGLENLTTINGDLFIGTNPQLTSLQELENIDTIGGSLSIINNDALIALGGLNNITFIGGSLDIDNNAVINNLGGLANLHSLGGILRIGRWYGYGNPNLTSLAGLENIDPGSITDLQITYNISLSECEAQSICNYLASPNGTIEIHDNAPGCNSQAEVEEACGIIGVEELSNNNDFSIYPNPSSSYITIEIFSKQTDSQLSILNLSGQQLILRQATEPKMEIDISNLPAGIYIVRLITESGTEVEKFIKF